MRRSRKSEHVWLFKEGEEIQDQKVKRGWYWFDETGQLYNQPYETEQEAIESLKRYAEQL